MPRRLIPRQLALIAAACLLPMLSACDLAGGDNSVPPPSAQSLAALAKGDLGADRANLARAIDGLFDDGVGETRALIVMRGPHIVAERYGEGYGRDTRFVGWSLTKTVTAVVTGMLIADGALALDEPAPVPRWQRIGDPRAAITVRHLLQMRSGLRHAEEAEPNYTGDTARMLYTDGRDDMARYAETQPLDADPGKAFAYSTATSVILADIATRALTDDPSANARHAAMAGYLHDRLFAPLGMTSAVPEFDAQGTFLGGSMLHATARDWGRFGAMLRDSGLAENRVRVIPRTWVRFMITPSPADPAYGAQLWLNRQRPEGRAPVLFPDKGSPRIFAMLGYRGQYVVVSPAQDLVVVRLGDTRGEEADARLRAAMATLVTRFGRAQ